MLARSLATLALAIAACACRGAPATVAPETEIEPRSGPARVATGLMTSLPIYWPEGGALEAMRDGDAAHENWVRRALEDTLDLQPIDTLDDKALSGLRTLILAQPRPLAPAENVALDRWVRAGGRLLLFADPMLTAHSRFPIGDLRRPQDVALLSPILRHWGLELTFDPEQPETRRWVDAHGVPLPVELGGRFKASVPEQCILAAEAALAECRIGGGKVLVLADAALLADAEPDTSEVSRSALAMLLSRAFD